MAGRLDIGPRQANGRFAFTSAQAERLREALGSIPTVGGLTRTEVIVLAALRNAPFGLASARAVARRSDLSVTAAARALESLRSKRLAELSTQMVAVGTAREVGIWRANLGHPRWPSLDPLLAQVQRPVRPSSRRDRPKRVPARLRHLFWNTAETQLDVGSAGAYIARRLLRTMDLQGLAWGAKTLAPQDWRQAARARGLDPKVKRLALNLAKAP